MHFLFPGEAMLIGCGCGKQLKVGDDLAGRRVKCPACGAVHTVAVPPEVGAVAAGPPPLPAPVEIPTLTPVADRLDEIAGAPEMWVNQLPTENVVILTTAAVYAATVKSADLRKIDLALEDGGVPEDLLGKHYWTAPLTTLTRCEFKQSSQMPNDAGLTLYYRQGGREQPKRLSLGQPTGRDEFVRELQSLLDWRRTAAPESRARVFVRYAVILAALVGGTLGLAAIYLAGWITHGPACFASLVNLFGVWGILGAGGVFTLLVGIACVAETANPPLLVTYEPADDA